jgi:F0F1-type ATP synthase epsilon subunit
VLIADGMRVLETLVDILEVEDRAGRFVARADAVPALTALVPSEVVMRKADGSGLYVEVGRGVLTKVGHEARLVVNRADVVAIEATPLAIAV